MLTEEQIEKRKHGIGGSDVAAILGISKYATAVDIYLEKTTDYKRPIDPDNPNIWWGNKLEDIIIERFILDYPQKFTKPETIYDKDYPFLFANVDALLGDGSVLEAKNVGDTMKYKWGMPFTNEVPREYLCQNLHYAAILDAPHAYFAAYFGGSDHRVYEYPRNPAVEKMVRDELCSFWENNVLKRVVPEAKSYEDQRKIWTKSLEESRVKADESLEDKIRRYRDLKEQMKALENEEASLKMDICGFMKDNEILDSVEGQILATWKNQTTNRFDLSKFKTDQSELHEQYLYKQESRVLRIKGMKNAA